MPAGVIEAAAAVVDVVAGAGTAAEIGAAATSVLGATGAEIAGDVIGGAALGAGSSVLTGADPGKSALFGSIAGLGSGLGSTVGSALGIGDTAGSILSSTAAGALGGAATGQNPLTSALLTGGTAAANQLIGSATSPSAQSGSGGGPSPSGAPAGVAATDPTATAPTPGPVTSEPLPSVATPSATGSSATIAPEATTTGGLGAIPTTGAQNFAPQLPAQLASAPSSITTPTLTDPASLPIAGQPAPSLPPGLATAPDSINLPSLTDPSNLTQVASGPQTSLGKFVQDPSLSNFGNILAKNPGSVLAGGALGLQALTTPQLPSETSLTKTLQGEAGSLAQQGALLSSYLESGTLPPGAEAAVKQATQAAKARARSLYPPGSTQLATALQQIDESAATQIFSIGDQLLQQGVNETGLAAQLYQNILNTTTTSRNATNASIANFAAAIAGGSRPIQLQVGGGG